MIVDIVVSVCCVWWGVDKGEKREGGGGGVNRKGWKENRWMDFEIFILVEIGNFE